MFSAYATVPVYEAFFRWLGWGEAIDPMVEAWRAGDRQRALEAAPEELIREIFIFGDAGEQKLRLARVRRGRDHDAGADADLPARAAARRDRRARAMIAERRVEVPAGGTRVLEVDGPRPEHPVLLFHGNPSNAGDWGPFLERLEGRRRAIAPDLLGWGKADRPASFHCDDGRARRLDRRPDRRARGRALRPASCTTGARSRSPRRRGARRRSSRVVILNVGAVRARLPLALGRAALAPPRRRRAAERDDVALRHPPAPAPGTSMTRARGPSWPTSSMTHLDRGTKRAILELYRDADPEKFAPIAASPRRRSPAPALVIWGDADPYIAARFADRHTRARSAARRASSTCRTPATGRGSTARTWSRRSCDFLSRVVGRSPEEAKPAAPMRAAGCAAQVAGERRPYGQTRPA